MALTNIREFVLGIEAEKKNTKKAIQNRTKAAALFGLRNLVLGTRVDTGRARGNWQVGEGDPPQGHFPMRFDPSGQATIAEGSTEILSVDGDKIIWIHNGVPYIEFLEDLDHMLEGTYQALQTWLMTQ